ncbi:hypothetical protein D3C72_995090 [compost metagenome]
MAGVHGLEHVEGLAAADLTHDDAVRAHTQGVSDEVADGHCAGALDVGGARLQADHVGLVELQFGGVLDRHDALVFGDEAREHVEQGRFTGAGAARDEDVHLGEHAGFQEAGHRLGQRAEAQQVAHAEALLRELTDGDGGAVEREGRDDHVHTGAVGQTRVHHRARLVDAAAEWRHDAVDHHAQLLLVGELAVGEGQLALLLDEDLLGAVDHDFRDGAVFEERFQRPVADRLIRDVHDQPGALGAARDLQIELLDDAVGPLGDLVAQDRLELGVAEALEGDVFELHLLDELGVDLLLDVFDLLALEVVRHQRQDLGLGGDRVRADFEGVAFADRRGNRAGDRRHVLGQFGAGAHGDVDEGQLGHLVGKGQDGLAHRLLGGLLDHRHAAVQGADDQRVVRDAPGQPALEAG